MALVPVSYFLTKGKGIHQKELRAFETALREAGIHTCNLVKVSSIIPPGCKRISKEEGMRLLQPGAITFAVLAQSATNEPGQLVGAGIGLAQPTDDTVHGYLTEVEETIGRTDADIRQDAEEMAIENLISEWGHENFDAESVQETGKKKYRLFRKELSVDSIAQTAKGADKNQYTVVVAAAVFILP
ncbi:MAG TPA: pyruvoyl-dependent arginine decarboxylase [Flavisolibacter sp.]|jgi:arginine decarboxylase|nr:pyruvoyl-dependent arginine decarboxylase [Flavisolibacter sp.]